MKITIRNAMMKDYQSVIEIMNQVQQMHVEWRPDIYKPNENLILMDVFEQIVAGDTFFVAETEEAKGEWMKAGGVVVGIMEIMFRHIESPSHVTRDVVFI